MSTNVLERMFPGSIETEHCYLLDCPFCDESLSLQIYAADVWRCVSCNRTGDLEALKKAYDAEYIVAVMDQMDKTRPPEGLIVVSEYVKPDEGKSASTGFNPIDRMLGGLMPGMLTVMTGKRGEGKSTFACQMALNLINEGKRVCFYSGELNATTFQSWIVNQAAGPRFVDEYIDRFGETRYRVDAWAKAHILTWLGDRLILYDNGVIKSSERNSIIERFTLANRFYGCEMFFVDNLMTARIPIDKERDYYRAQSNFVRDLTAFAIANNAHVIMIAHPRKNTGDDLNDAIAGTGDITNLASNVMAIIKKEDTDWDSEIEITKNRQYGTLGTIRFTFDRKTRRYKLLAGTQTEKYGWEDEI